MDEEAAARMAAAGDLAADNGAVIAWLAVTQARAAASSARRAWFAAAVQQWIAGGALAGYLIYKLGEKALDAIK